MILGLDGGLATCGWALLDEEKCSFVDLGVVIQKPVEGVKITIDRMRRSFVIAQIIAKHAPRCNKIVVESLSLGMPGAIAKLSVGLTWGVILGIVAMLDPTPELLTIPPQRWQREVLPHAGKQVSYDELATAAGAYILRNHPKAAKALGAIKPKDRNHAIDAAMIALCGSLRSSRCDRIEGRAA